GATPHEDQGVLCPSQYTGGRMHVAMFQSSGRSDTKSPVYTSQASLVLIYRLTMNPEMKGVVDLAHPGI
ncbi:hypothetical protein TNCV_1673061, partial [Trichonephila clavipes]